MAHQFKMFRETRNKCLARAISGSPGGMMTTLDYRTQVAAQVEQNAAEQKAAANEAAWQEIINRYVIKDHAANRRMVEDFCNGTIELAKFKFLVDNPPAGFQLDWSTEDVLKIALIEKILAARQYSP